MSLAGPARLTALLIAIMMLLGCASPMVTAPRPNQPRAMVRTAQVEAQLTEWESELEAIRAEAVPLLMALSDYSHHLPSVATRTSLVAPHELWWDPPINPTWSEISPELDPIIARAAQLHHEVSVTVGWTADWRLRRAASEATRALLSMATGMASYHEAVESLSPGNDDLTYRGLLHRAREDWLHSQLLWEEAIGLGQAQDQ